MNPSDIKELTLLIHVQKPLRIIRDITSEELAPSPYYLILEFAL